MDGSNHENLAVGGTGIIYSDAHDGHQKGDKVVILW